MVGLDCLLGRLLGEEAFLGEVSSVNRIASELEIFSSKSKPAP